VTGIPSLDLSYWKESPDLLPQQFNSESLYPQLKEEEEEDHHVAESPARPGFPQPGVTGAAGDKLQFVSEEAADIFRKPAIGQQGLRPRG
jgi:hypothetical protein